MVWEWSWSWSVGDGGVVCVAVREHDCGVGGRHFAVVEVGLLSMGYVQDWWFGRESMGDGGGDCYFIRRVFDNDHPPSIASTIGVSLLRLGSTKTLCFGDYLCCGLLDDPTLRIWLVLVFDKSFN